MQSPSLESLLADKDLRVDFIFYVNKIHAQESLLFWMEVEIFKRITDSDECAKQAKLLYYRYLHPQSKSEVNVEGRLKVELEDVIARGIWDQTLFNNIQENVAECLKYGVVRSFLETSKRKSVKPKSPTPTHVVLERYEDVVHKQDKENGHSKSPLWWLHPKLHKKENGHPKKEKATLLGKGSQTMRIKKSRKEHIDKLVSEALSDPEDIVGGSLKEKKKSKRISQQALQQQIQLLRNLHQYQQSQRNNNNTVDTIKEEEENPWENLANTMPTTLLKSASVPVIAPTRT